MIKLLPQNCASRYTLVITIIFGGDLFFLLQGDSSASHRQKVECKLISSKCVVSLTSSPSVVHEELEKSSSKA